MSHLSRIKTSIKNKKVLQETLRDLGFKYEAKLSAYSTITNLTQKEDITVKKNETTKFKFSWNGEEYLLIADLNFWNLDISCEGLLNKIMQQYSYNSIIKESIKHGFTNTNQQILSDGSVKLILQRWN